MCLPWFHFSHLELRVSSCPVLSPQGKCDMPFPTQLFREFWHVRLFTPLGNFHFLTHFSGHTALPENLILESILWSNCLIKCAYRKTGLTSWLLSKLLPFPGGGFMPCTSRCLILPRYPSSPRPLEERGREMSSEGKHCYLFCSLVYPKSLEQCLEHGWHLHVVVE